MTLHQYMKNHPGYFIIVLIGFLTFLFLPIVALSIFGLLWLIHKFKDTPQSADILPYETGNHFKIDPTLTGQFMSAEDKSAYLQSPKWQALRQQVIARDKCCVVTGRTSNLDVHHITYKRLGNELLEDLVLIHRDVHNAIHQKLGYDRTTYFPISAYKD